MQGLGDINRSSLSQPSHLFRRTLDSGSMDEEDTSMDIVEDAEKKKDEMDVIEAVENKTQGTISCMGSEKKKEDNDFIMEDVSKVPDISVLMNLNEGQGKAQVGATTFGENLLDKTIQNTPLKDYNKNAGNFETGGWCMIDRSNGSANRQTELSIPPDSTQKSSDEFSFDSEEEIEDETAKISKDISSITKTLDLGLLRDSIRKGEETLRFIEGQDVTLVVGKTGTGKSTLIQGIAGKMFTESLYPCVQGGKVAPKKVFDAVDPIPGFEIGHAKISRTKHIKSYVIGRSSNSCSMKQTSDKLYFLDTPGFEDTEGEEVDIATSVMLSQVSKKCRSMRFIIMINFVSLLDDRGGAMRSTLRFIRNFVRNFAKHKQSFMFLFTHADEIRKVPESLKEAKNCLLSEIIETMEGTKSSDDAIEILRFIRKCLEKNYPFVDVLHPLKTDFSGIIRFVEDKMQPIKLANEKNSSCTLTNSSKMRLAGAIRKLQSTLHLSLQKKPIDIKEVRQIQKTFQFFEKYIDFDEMRRAVVDCNEVIGGHIEGLYKIIMDEVKNGTTKSADSLFNEYNVSLIKDALEQLKSIDSNNFDKKAESDRIRGHVTRFQKDLFLDKGSKLHGYHEKLQKMNAWCTLGQEYQNMFDNVVARANKVIREVVEDVSKFNPYQTNELTEVSSSLKTLKSIEENSSCLSLYLAGITDASDAYNEFTSRLKSHFQKAMNSRLSSPAEVQVFDFRHPERVHNLSNQIQSLEKLSGLINGTNTHDDILPIVRDVRKLIESQTVENFGKTCSEIEDTFKSGNHENLSNTFTFLRDSMSFFSTFEGDRWKEMEFSYNTAVDKVKYYVKTKAHELDEMSLSLLKHGVIAGKRDGEFMKSFAAWRWVDSLLPQEERFVENCLNDARNNYFHKFIAVTQTIKEAFFRLSSNTGELESGQVYFDRTKELAKKLVEINECAHFGSITGDKELQGISTQLFSQFHDYLRQREPIWKKDLKAWIDLAFSEDNNWQKVTAATEILNGEIGEINEVSNLKLDMCGVDFKSFAISIKNDMISALAKYGIKVERSLDSHMSYEGFAELLSRVRAFGKFTNTAPYLPQIEHLKKEARQLIARDAKEIEDMLKETSEFDTIDSLLKNFEKATVLDEFVCQDVTSYIRPLKRLREENSKQSKIEELVETITMCLKKMDDQLLYEIDEQMNEENAIKIASCLQTLEESSSVAQNMHMEKFNHELNEIFCKLQDTISTAIGKMDFKLVVEQNSRATVISRHFGKFLSKTSTTNMETNLADFSTLKSSISDHINEFIESSFTKSKNIEKILHHLKFAEATHEPIYDELSQLYKESTQSLMEQVKNFIQTVQKANADAQCYDDSIIIIKNLVCCLNKDLKHHLPPDLLNQCEELMRTFTQVRKEQESEWDFGSGSVDKKIREITRKLNKSAPSSTWWKAFSPLVSGRHQSYTYERLKRKLTDKTLQTYKRGCQSLEKREFITLNKSLEVLFLVDLIAGKHVQAAAEKLHDLKQKSVESFQVLCGSCQDALEANDCRQFEPLFGDFRGFVLKIACLMDDSDSVASFRRVNKLVYERFCKEVLSLETPLRNFEFIAIKEKIEYLRDFGGFIADNYSLLHEELKGYSHVVDDKSLDEIKSVISQHFQHGRNLQRIKYYAILECLPSATKAELKSAFKRKSLTCHPDKCKDELDKQEWNDKFIGVKDAYDQLLQHCYSNVRKGCYLPKPFDDAVRSLDERLREATRNALSEQHYDQVENILYKLQGIEVLRCLKTSKLDPKKMRDSIHSLVKNHVAKVRTEVDTNWAERKYQDLNYNIKDLKTMENKFKSYPQIFSTSWNTGIIKKVETEIEKLGKDARAFSQNEKKANENRDTFRRCFLKMGAVLVELPEFKNYTKQVMSDILESCLNSNWGYSFVFKLGLSLQRGGETQGETDGGEARIGQNLVSEFQQFKEVLTMVWNEETIQKPPEETIGRICGQLLNGCAGKATDVRLDSDKLLEQYFEFDSTYKSFLGEYLAPEADIKALVQKTIKTCENLKPISIDNGFGAKTKHALPTILAGIFAVLTIIKSGESYKRLEEDSNLSEIDAEKVLMKPHNIQVLTLLCMFGCGTLESASLKSQLMQIRTGEGKSMILGATAVVFGLLDFRVRCVCYSEYLSTRDFELFHDVFDHFGLLGLIKYSKITALSEDTTAAKGNIRDLTLSLLHGTLSTSSGVDYHHDSSMTTLQKTEKECTEEIILVDEVDVFFGTDFYGQTYNQVAQLKEPEVATIMRRIWEANKQRKRLRLADIKAMPEYEKLIEKIPGYDYLVENEVILMLDQVQRVDNEPTYHLDHCDDRIGYKVQDTISYNVTYGYRTVFAYLKEADNGNLKDANATLSRVLTMPISCGQFSYANIRPKRILGVSGTLEFMSDHEKGVLQNYGVNQYLYIPSVYGKSNFAFDKSGDGVSIEKSVGDFFHRITKEISEVATKKNRAVIVFFDSKRLHEFTSSAFYRKLGRKKEILTEDKNSNEKEFVISKAATAGQITICSSVFGRGTDFFCKDDILENNGGVHVIQAFLSADISEEVQIQGRTARQGKQGSYELILLEEDLEKDFAIKIGSVDKWPKCEYYTKLCDARKKILEEKYARTEINLLSAKEKDEATHNYFDALLQSNHTHARNLFKDLYLNMKKAPVRQMTLDLAFAIDITGSMAPYENAINSTIQSLLTGSDSVLVKLEPDFPCTEFTLRVAIFGFRDIDDGSNPFEDLLSNTSSHFSDDFQDVLDSAKALTSSSSGGADIAEDHLGAIEHCLNWNSASDWEGMVKAIVLLTDAPAHGHAPTSTMAQSIDKYNGCHPLGLTVDSTVDKLVEKDVDLFVCSFDPDSTAKFVDALEERYNEHSSNDGRKATMVPLVPPSQVQNSASCVMGNSKRHNIFVLDESGSMSSDWDGLVSVYNKYIKNRLQHQHNLDLVSIIQFGENARETCQMKNISDAPDNLDFKNCAWTKFGPAATSARGNAAKTPSSHVPVVIFMSDGIASDYEAAATEFAALNRELGGNLDLHVIGFGRGTDTTQLQHIARSSPKGRVHAASNIDSLSKVFIEIASGGNSVASVLEAEISKRISDAVTDRLLAEYVG